MLYMSQLKKFQSWLTAYRKANDKEPTIKNINAKIKELLKEEKESGPSKNSSKKIYFRESKWSDYEVLRKELAQDKKFVEEYKGLDLKAYIEDALAWSEKGNLSTEMGWLLTLRNWIRKAKREGKLIMKPIIEQLPKGGHINY